MNDARLLERIAATDVYGEGQQLPAEIWTTEAALQEIERMAGTRSIDRPDAVVLRPIRPRRPLIVAAAALAVVLALGVAAALFALATTDEPDVIEPAPATPLGVVQALNQAIGAGDIHGMRAVWADDATRVGTFGGVGNANDPFDLSERCLSTTSDSPVSTSSGRAVCWFAPTYWDDDLAMTGYDDMMELFAWLSMLGVAEPYVDCTQTGRDSVTCSHSTANAAFQNAPPDPASRTTFVIRQGRVAHVEMVSPFQCQPGILGRTCGTALFGDGDRGLLHAYKDWLYETQPADVSSRLANFANIRLGPETLEDHRRLLAEWRAQS